MSLLPFTLEASDYTFGALIMYLLNTRTLTFESFYGFIPKYAILSHTWGEKEVTFQDIQNRDKDKSDRKVSGDVSGDKSGKEVSEDKSDREVSGDDSDREVSGDDSDREVSGNDASNKSDRTRK
ncbi:hypothetical protein K435DRAFT_808231 [Dendrothele bispora CBS 962.96]|uniref:Uncharacterized protein n=1 Tax=Dendrothele bispora (strain CBS 962.96) TaxID=1314807 RepID=A0A4S8L3F1_DENBC|nr:hypothetical protein K435DRAFT_808231 [Dendrothele bispora CBS 962.96]